MSDLCQPAAGGPQQQNNNVTTDGRAAAPLYTVTVGSHRDISRYQHLRPDTLF